MLHTVNRDNSFLPVLTLGLTENPQILGNEAILLQGTVGCGCLLPYATITQRMIGKEEGFY